VSRTLRVLALALVLLHTGCSWSPSFWPFTPREKPLQGDPRYGIEVLDAGTVVEFYDRAQRFYGRLANRRFNVLATFRDETLREYFRSDRAFSDYYSDFAQDLDDQHFARNRPTELEVVEFLVDGPGQARVRIRLRGRDGRPLRPWSVAATREDQWERLGGEWWVIPGKL